MCHMMHDFTPHHITSHHIVFSKTLTILRKKTYYRVLFSSEFICLHQRNGSTTDVRNRYYFRYTVEPRHSEPLYNEILDILNEQFYSPH